MQDQLTHRMALTAIAQQGSGGFPLVPTFGYEPGERSGGPGAVRRGARVVRALVRLTGKRTPKWAAGLMAACLAIPGPVDEVIVWPVVVAFVVIANRAEFAAVAREAWQR